MSECACGLLFILAVVWGMFNAEVPDNNGDIS